jgi:hypothetical protein
MGGRPVLEIAVALVMVGTTTALFSAPRVRHAVSVRDLMMVARATGSLRACLAFLWFCWRHR